MKKLTKRKFNNESLAIIASNISRLNSDGIPFLNILELLKEIPLSREYKESICKIQLDMQSGESFEDSLKKHKRLFPEFFISMVSIGEKSGRLNESLKEIKEYYSKISFVRKSIMNALSYPCVLIGTMITLSIFLVFFIIPSFFDVYKSMGIEIPQKIMIIYKSTEMLKEEPLIITIYIICWGIFIPYLIIKYMIRKNLKIPFEKIPAIREFYEYISISLLSIIVRSGINLSLGLNYCAESFSNSFINNKFINIDYEIIKGKTLSEALEKVGGYSEYSISIVKLGEASGSMEERLTLLSAHLEKKSLEKINKTLSYLQPVLILIMATVILIFITTFILPLFNSMMAGVR